MRLSRAVKQPQNNMWLDNNVIDKDHVRSGVAGAGAGEFQGWKACFCQDIKISSPASWFTRLLVLREIL
jgi:hypothetical protein